MAMGDAATKLDAGFCVDAVKEAPARYGTPGVFNTDQGSQFISETFIAVLKKEDVKICMDGKGRALDSDFGKAVAHC